MGFFRRFLSRQGRLPPVALSDRRVFAFGDIHGCVDLLDCLLAAIADEVQADSQPPLLIFLGDFVDRGPDSRAVLDRLIGLVRAGGSARFLAGNHEEALLKFISDLEGGMAWPGYGGRATLLSYGVSPPVDETDLAAWRTVHAAFRKALPPAHKRFLFSLEDRIELGDYLFVHAGVDPAKPLNGQSARDLRWIREPFLSDPRFLGKVIVHGHTPATEPYADHRRIGVDTWAYRNGVLTAVELDGARVSMWQARRGEDGAITAGRAADPEHLDMAREPAG